MALNFLIVDDSANIRAFVKKTLNMVEMEIGETHEAADGLEALEVLKQQPVDIILTDINMPNMDGLEMTKQIRAQKQYDAVKIIIISTEGSREMILDTVKAGATGYLRKPFGPEQALEILQEATGTLPEH